MTSKVNLCTALSISPPLSLPPPLPSFPAAECHSPKTSAAGLLHFLAVITLIVMQMEVKPDEQWLRDQISAYFESEHELALDGRSFSALL